MGPCPSETVLVQFLSGGLPAESEPNVAAHLQDCLYCQERADQLSDDAVLRELDRERRKHLAWSVSDGTAELRKSLYALVPSTWDRLVSGGNRYGLDARRWPSRMVSAHLSRGTGRSDLSHRDWRLAHSGAGPAASQPPSSGGQSLGRFILRRRLGSGSSGVVYLADDTLLERQVALKLPRIPALVDPEMGASFAREARAAAGLHHPNIVPIFEAGQIGEICYLASAYCSGPTLGQWFREQRRPLAPELAARIVLQLAEAVGHAHRRGILHRDLKPANVLLEPLESDGEFPFTPKLTDFGLAKILGSDQTAAGSGILIGTPRYMAPEQAAARQSQCGPASDVYALGAILYELLTGRPPIAGEDNAETLARLMVQEPPTVRRLNRDVPRDLEAICGKCLHKNPSRRYDDAVGLAEDLQRFLSRQATLARPTGAIETVGRWVRRHPTAAVLIGLSLLAMIATVAGLHLHNQSLQELNAQLDAAADREHDSREKTERFAADLARSQERAADLLYASDLKLAALAWRERDARQARELLMRHRPSAGEPDRRGFEWRYLWNLGEVEHDVLEESATGLGCVCFSPDGRFRASAGVDSRVTVTDARTSTVVQTIEVPARINGAAFSPDGEWLVTAGEDGSVCIWDRRSGNERLRIEAHPSGANHVVFIPALHAIASCGREPIVRVWDAQTGDLRHELLGHEDFVGALAVSPDGKRLASAGRDKTARVWNPDTGSELLTLRAHDSEVTALAFAPDGRMLATGSLDQAVRVWNTASGEMQGEAKHPDEVHCVTFSPEEDQLAVGDRLGTVYLYRVGGAEDPKGLDQTRVWHAHEGRIRGLQFDAHLGRLISAGQEGRVTAWRPVPYCGWHHLAAPAGIRDFAFAPSSNRVLITTGAGQLLSWQCTSPSFAPLAIEVAHDWSCVSTASQSSRCAAGALDGAVGVWEISSDRAQQVCIVSAGAPVEQIALSSDGRRLAVVCLSAGEPVLVFDVESGRRVASLPFTGCRSIAFSPDAASLAIASGADVVLWDLERNIQLHQLRQHTEAVNEVAFSPDGMRLASCGDDRRLLIWDVASGGLLHSLLGYRSAVQSLAFSPEGRSLLAGSARGRLKAWRVANGAELCALEAQPTACRKLAVSSDGDWIACLLRDGRVAVHQVGSVEND